MKPIAIFLIAIYIFSVTYAGPVKKKSKDIALEEKDVIYTGQHDIVKIYTSIILMEEIQNRIVFFIEGDINKDGSTVNKGLYVIVNNSTTKLLDSGRDIAGDAAGKVFFATNKGLYTYSQNDNIALKYSDMSDSIISLAVENNTGVIYALTENHVLFKITENGSKSNVDERVKHAQEIILDTDDNLYFYDEDKNLHVVVDQKVKKIEGLPKTPNSIKLIRPPYGITFEGIVLVADNEPYRVFSNGTAVISEDTTLKRINPTAYSFDALVVLYFGYEKKIYEYNIIEKVLTGILESIAEWAKKNLSFITFS